MTTATGNGGPPELPSGTPRPPASRAELDRQPQEELPLRESRGRLSADVRVARHEPLPATEATESE